MRVGVLALAVVALTANQAFADIDRGLEAYQAGNYEAAYEEWAADAELGDPVGQYLLGHLYESGLGVTEDPLTAYAWYELAAAQGYEDAETARARIETGLSDDQRAALRSEPSEDAVTELAEEPFTPEEALLDAVLRNDAALAAELLAEGGDPNLRFSDGDPVLLEAARRGHAGLALTLIGAGADIEAPGEDGWTPLMVAIDAGHERLAVLLARQGADGFGAAPDGTTAFDLATAQGLDSVLAEIGSPSPVAAAAPSPAALIDAAEAGNGDRVAALIGSGADPNGTDDDGWTALMFAAFGGHDAVVRQLIDAGAKVDAQAADGSTAVMTATLGNKPATLRLLLNQGAKAGRRTRSGASALQIAEQNGFDEIATLLRARLGPPRELVAEAQSLLDRLGYAPGPVDGAMGPKTRAAVKAFQRDHGTAANGRISQALLSDLREADVKRVGDRAAASAWARVKSSGNPGDLLAFAAEFPESQLAEEARQRANSLAVQVIREKAAQPAPQAQPQQPRRSQPQNQAENQTVGQTAGIQWSSSRQVPQQEIAPGQAQAPQGAPRRSSRRASSQPAPQAAPQTAPQAAPAGPSPQERADWATVMGRGQPEDFAAYLRAYPNGAFAPQALYFLEQQPVANAPANDARGPAAIDLTPVAQYLSQRPQHFHGQVNAYNKRNQVVASGNQSTYKVREVYEAKPFGAENGAYKVSVLLGVGNWQGESNNAGLTVERVVLFLEPAGNSFRIVGHSKERG